MGSVGPLARRTAFKRSLARMLRPEGASRCHRDLQHGELACYSPPTPSRNFEMQDRGRTMRFLALDRRSFLMMTTALGVGTAWPWRAQAQDQTVLRIRSYSDLQVSNPLNRLGQPGATSWMRSSPT